MRLILPGLGLAAAALLLIGPTVAATIPFPYEDFDTGLWSVDTGTIGLDTGGLGGGDTGFAFAKSQFEECRDRAVALYDDCMAYQTSGNATHPPGRDWLEYAQELCTDMGLREYGRCMGHYSN